MEKLPKIPENADKLTEDASIEVLCGSFSDFDMVSFFNQCGYNTVSSDDEKAADPSTFMYDKRTSTLSTPFVKPEDVLPLMQELQQKFEQNKIGYFIFKTKYRDQFLEPKSENQSEVLSDGEVLKYLLSQNLETENVMKTWIECFKENISADGPLKIYRGTSMGDAAHTTIIQSANSVRGVFTYATPNILTARSYASHDTTSHFNFVEEYQASPNQKYSCDHGLESNECYKNLNWQDLREAHKAFETFVEKETNPHLRTYLAYGEKLYKIYENGQYVDKFWEKYAQSRRPKMQYRNDNVARRVQNIIDEGRCKKFVAKKKLMEENPIMTDLSLYSMCNLYFLTKNEVIKKKMLSELYEIRKNGNTDKEKRKMADKFKSVLDNNPDLRKDENLVALSKIDTIISQPTKFVRRQITH